MPKTHPIFPPGPSGISAIQTVLPVGTVIPYAGPLTDPKVTGALEASGWMNCDGRTLSAARFCELFAVIAHLYGGSGDDFRLPDYRGTFLRAVAEDKSQDPGIDNRIGPDGQTSRAVGSTQNEMVQTHQHQYANFPALPPPGIGGPASPALSLNNISMMRITTGLFTDNTGLASLSGEETRPRNTYIHYLIRWTAASGCALIPGQIG